MMKLEKILDRNLKNTHLKINKASILESLKSTQTNNTYLKHLQKQSAEIEEQLLKIGINAQPYKTLAAYAIRKENDHYLKELNRKLDNESTKTIEEVDESNTFQCLSHKARQISKGITHSMSPRLVTESSDG